MIMDKKIRVAVFGAAGYAGEELLRLLLRHPNAEIAAITSRKNAGEDVAAVFPRFTGLPLKFVAPAEAMESKSVAELFTDFYRLQNNDQLPGEAHMQVLSSIILRLGPSILPSSTTW